MIGLKVVLLLLFVAIWFFTSSAFAERHCIQSVSLPKDLQGHIHIAVHVSHPESAHAKVAMDVALDGGDYHAARIMESMVKTASADNAQHQLKWDMPRDLGFRAKNATLRFTAQDSRAFEVDIAVPQGNNVRAALQNVNHYMVDYGDWEDSSKIELAKTYQLVILHPRKLSVTRQLVASIQAGVNPSDPADDVIVLGYISVGEDLRSVGLTPEQMRNDPRFIGNGQGPRIDPRGPYFGVDERPLDNIPILGAPSTGGLGFASYYLDDNDVYFSANHVGNGLPDQNGNFGGAFVNAGDPAWFDVLQNMQRNGVDRLPGFQEILTDWYGLGLACDGVFLDTIDTCAPDIWTNEQSSNPSKFEWTAPGFSQFVTKVRNTYSDKIVLQNRGDFFFDPKHPQYKYTTRSSIDLLFFESYYLDSNPVDLPNPYHSADNRYNYMPKIRAEADRSDGFRVLSLGYAEGPPDQMSLLTLTEYPTVSLGFNALMTDIHLAQNEAGFRHYISNAAVDYPNSFVRTYGSLDDNTPPVWASTYNALASALPVPGPYTPRIGIQKAECRSAGTITVQWDVAIDMTPPVNYRLYMQTWMFDFANNPTMAGVPSIVLEKSIGDGYVNGVGPDVYPYQATVPAASGNTWYLCVRAYDSTPAQLEEHNTYYTSVYVS